MRAGRGKRARTGEIDRPGAASNRPSKRVLSEDEGGDDDDDAEEEESSRRAAKSHSSSLATG